MRQHRLFIFMSNQTLVNHVGLKCQFRKGILPEVSYFALCKALDKAKQKLLEDPQVDDNCHEMMQLAQVLHDTNIVFKKLKSSG